MEERTEIQELGEFGLIGYLTKNIEIRNSSTILGVGDDAAVIDHFGRQTVMTTDLLAEGIHFDLTYTPLRHLGYKSIIVNLSDLYAMNATPTQVMLGLAFSNRFSVELLSEFYEGVYLACEKYGVDLVGGDTSSSLKGFFISVTAIGEVSPDQYIRRSTAKKGNLLCVSGDLGAAYLGLQLLEREKKIYLESPGVQPDLEGEAYVIGRYLKPEARKDIVQFFVDQQITPTAMMDISDGLSSEIFHICTQSGTGCALYSEKIPIHPDSRNAAAKFNLDPVTCALNGGEDYELLFTIRQEDYDTVQRSPLVSIIGHMTGPEDGIHLLTSGGDRIPLAAQGWNAFGT
jgi:thiamine-monophosphate kinase